MGFHRGMNRQRVDLLLVFFRLLANRITPPTWLSAIQLANGFIGNGHILIAVTGPISGENPA
ncbi:hypothetical protein M8494_12285 [Serratia ureilytica]